MGETQGERLEINESESAKRKCSKCKKVLRIKDFSLAEKTYCKVCRSKYKTELRYKGLENRELVKLRRKYLRLL